MGSYAGRPRSHEPAEDAPGDQKKLGDILAGRLADVDVDSVKEVREERKRE
jgi:hypothetical protein